MVTLKVRFTDQLSFGDKICNPSVESPMSISPVSTSPLFRLWFVRADTTKGDIIAVVGWPQSLSKIVQSFATRKFTLCQLGAALHTTQPKVRENNEQRQNNAVWGTSTRFSESISSKSNMKSKKYLNIFMFPSCLSRLYITLTHVYAGNTWVRQPRFLLVPGTY